MIRNWQLIAPVSSDGTWVGGGNHFLRSYHLSRDCGVHGILAYDLLIYELISAFPFVRYHGERSLKSRAQ